MIYVGVPLLLFMIGGTCFLQMFMDAKLEVRDRQQGQSVTVRKFDLEEEHKLLMSKLDLDDFSLSRIPRPEDPTSVTTANNSTPKNDKIPAR